MQQNTGTQLLEKILHERKKANGAVKRERGLAYGGCWKVRGERPPPGRLAAPGTVSCRALFLAFQIHPRSAPRCAGGEPSWVRLAGCIPGTPALQKMAARTMQLALELSALMDAGLLWRFTDSPPPGRGDVGHVDLRLCLREQDIRVVRDAQLYPARREQPHVRL